MTKELSETELALTDAIKTVLEAVITAHPEALKYLARALETQRDEKIHKDPPAFSPRFASSTVSYR